MGPGLKHVEPMSFFPGNLESRITDFIFSVAGLQTELIDAELGMVISAIFIWSVEQIKPECS